LTEKKDDTFDNIRQPLQTLKNMAVIVDRFVTFRQD